MIKINNLSFSYQNSIKDQEQLKNINLEVKKGELIVLSGKSGCGKSTLTRILNGLCPAFFPGTVKGSYYLDGEDALKIPIARLGTLTGSVFQDPRSQFFATNTTDEITLGMENVPLSREVMHERVNKVCKEMNITHLLNRSIFPLSSGEKQLIAIASVATMNPKVIILDEPSANLDSEAIIRVGALLYRLKENGHTIILSEHRFYYVRDSFDKLVVMKDGSIDKIYTREEALEIKDEKLKEMGLRSFNLPHFTPRGSYIESKNDNLEVTGVSALLDKTEILDDVSFSTKYKNVLAIAGPNGAGKSTLCKVITGLIKATGTVSIDGCYLKRKKRIENSFFVAQDADYQLYAPTLLDEFFLEKKRSKKEEERVLFYLKKMGLDELTNRHPASLSGGQKQRLLLALAAVSDRKILVFDEPTSGLDGYNMHITVDLLKELANDNRIILLITHDMELIKEVADSILYIEKGVIKYYKSLK